MYRNRKILTVAELQAELDAFTSDEEDNVSTADKINIVVIPPDKVDELTDNEEIDDNVQILREEATLPKEIPGQFEIEYTHEVDNLPAVVETQNERMDMEIDSCAMKPSTSKSKIHTPIGNKPKWSKSIKYNFQKQPIDNEKQLQKTLYERIGKICDVVQKA